MWICVSASPGESLPSSFKTPFLQILCSTVDKYNQNEKREMSVHLLNMLEHVNVLSGTKRERLVIEGQG